MKSTLQRNCGGNLCHFPIGSFIAAFQSRCFSISQNLFYYICMDVRVACLIHIAWASGPRPHLLFILQEQLSGCPISYEVRYKSTLALTPFRCTNHSFIGSTVIKPSLTHSPKAHLVVKILHALVALTSTWIIHLLYTFLSCTCCTQPHLLHSTTPVVSLNSLLNTHL